jgi:hypothetical protein
VLEKLLRSQTEPHRDVQRGRVLLMASGLGRRRGHPVLRRPTQTGYRKLAGRRASARPRSDRALK